MVSSAPRLIRITPDTPILDCLERYCLQHRAADSSRQAYRTDMAQAARLMQEWGLEPVLKNLTPAVALDLEATWMGQYAQTSVDRKVSCLRALLHFCRIFVPDVKDPWEETRRPKAKVKTPDRLTQSEFVQLMGPEAKWGRNPARNKALLSFLFYTGSRRSVVPSLTWGDISLERNTIYLRPNKGSPERTLEMTSDLSDALREYRRSLGYIPQADAPVFLSEQGHGLTDRGVFLAVKQHGIRNGVPRLHPHLWRHTLCTHMALQGHNSSVIAKVAGHKWEGTAAKYYIHIADKDAGEALSALQENRREAQTNAS